MSPVFTIESGIRYSIFSNEESRMHVHAFHGKKEAKIWLEPTIELAENKGFNKSEIKNLLKTVKNNEQNFKTKYKAHIG